MARHPTLPTSTPSTTASASYDARVLEALEDYLRLSREGRRPDRDQFLAGHAEFARELSGCLAGLEFFERVAVGSTSSVDGAGSIGDFAPPARLDDFQIVRELGRGGMGVVYEAEQLSLGRRVALKVLPSAASLDSRQRRRFHIEAQAAALLHHEHIVPVFGAGSDQGVPYYVMQFIAGWSLAEAIRVLRSRTAPDDSAAADDSRSPLLAAWDGLSGEPAAEPYTIGRRHCDAVVRLGVQAAEALDHAHSLGVVHRDVKPSNLLLDGRGHLWVADFGLAYIAQGDAGLTRTGDLVGTLRYMGPELVRGEQGGSDPRADVYALGVTLYELLTLQPAFDASNGPSLTHLILTHEPISPRRLNPAIPPDLETIVIKAMSKEPAGRYASARELAEDLDLFLQDRPIRARRPGALMRLTRWGRRHRAAVLAVGGLLFAALGIAAGSLWTAERRTAAAMREQSRSGYRARVAFELSHASMEHFAGLFAEKIAAGSHTLSDDELRRICRGAIDYNDRVARLFSEGGQGDEVAAKASRSSGALRMLLNDRRADADYLLAAALYEQAAARHPEYIWLRTGLIATRTEYATGLRARGDHVEAEDQFRQALQAAEAVVADERAHKSCFTLALKDALNGLAWGLVEEPSVDVAEAKRAVRLAEQATAWDGSQPAFWNTLGLARHRAGDAAAAVVALEKGMRLADGGGPMDWLALAIACRDADPARAEALLDRTDAWSDGHADEARNPSLLRLRREAAQKSARSNVSSAGRDVDRAGR